MRVFRKTQIAAVTLFVLTSLVCSGCWSGKTPIHKDDPPAVKALKKAGAEVQVQPTMAAKDMKGWSVDLSGMSLDRELFELLGNVESLIAVILKDPDVTDETLAMLPEMPSVQRLDLTGSSVTNEGLKHLTGYRNLVTLNLSDTKVTGAGLSELPAGLSGVILYNLAIEDGDLQNMNHMKKLSIVGLVGTGVSPEAVRSFKRDRPFLLTIGVKLD